MLAVRHRTHRILPVATLLLPGILCGLLLCSGTGFAAEPSGTAKERPATTPAPERVAGRSLEEWSADLSSPNRIVALRAVLTIGQFGQSASEVLIEALAHQRPGVRYWAASELGDIGHVPAAAFPRLTELLADEQIGVQLAASYALCRSGQLEKSLPLLTKSLSHPTRGVRNAAADFLARIGPPARAAVPALEQALEHKDYHTKGAAREALLRIRGVPQPDSEGSSS